MPITQHGNRRFELVGEQIDRVGARTEPAVRIRVGEQLAESTEPRPRGQDDEAIARQALRTIEWQQKRPAPPVAIRVNPKRVAV
jgi:hypothetical protein